MKPVVSAILAALPFRCMPNEAGMTLRPASRADNRIQPRRFLRFRHGSDP
jgi:hypothetical protein